MHQSSAEPYQTFGPAARSHAGGLHRAAGAGTAAAEVRGQGGNLSGAAGPARARWVVVPPGSLHGDARMESAGHTAASGVVL